MNNVVITFNTRTGKYHVFAGKRFVGAYDTMLEAGKVGLANHKAKPKIVTEVIKRYYVMIDDWTYGGPFDTREEAQACLKEAPKTGQI